MAAQTPAAGFATPAARLAGFTGHLRINGFKIGLRETEDLIRCFAAAPLQPIDGARRCMKIMLSGRREDWMRFDDLFDAYWRPYGRRRDVFSAAENPSKRLSEAGRHFWRDHLGEDSGADKSAAAPPAESPPGDRDISAGALGRLAASLHEPLFKADLRSVSDPAEIAAAEDIARKLAAAMRHRISRRFRVNARGRRLDLRKIIRASLSKGGSPHVLIRKARRQRPMRVVALLDVSGSMQTYSRFFLQFVKGFVCAWIDSDAYVFHTKLVRITDAVREKNPMKAMKQLSLTAQGFGGGTKIGESLCVFNNQHAKRALNARTAVIILSDGYDTGAPETLGRELARLKKRARRIIWLNPLLGWRRYQPVNEAMKTALPHVDHFAAANTLEALAAVEAELARL